MNLNQGKDLRVLQKLEALAKKHETIDNAPHINKELKAFLKDSLTTNHSIVTVLAMSESHPASALALPVLDAQLHGYFLRISTALFAGAFSKLELTGGQRMDLFPAVLAALGPMELDVSDYDEEAKKLLLEPDSLFHKLFVLSN